MYSDFYVHAITLINSCHNTEGLNFNISREI